MPAFAASAASALINSRIAADRRWMTSYKHPRTDDRPFCITPTEYTFLDQ